MNSFKLEAALISITLMTGLTVFFIGLLWFVFSLGTMYGLIGAPIYVGLWLVAFREAHRYWNKWVRGKNNEY